MRLALCVSLLLLLPSLLQAQPETVAATPPASTPENPVATATKIAQQQRPKIGVALEGGGAMGLAHIGVLKWFEEHHIPVDYVAGTSMGGLVGGLYATGMTPEEMQELIEGLDWRKILGDRTPYEDLSYRRKEDQRAYPNSLIFGLRNGLSAPAGIIPGHQIGLLIDRVTLPYYGISSFDDMPIPFRCVATDLVSSQSHVFQNGSLAGALRSTMSIPGAFSPVREGKAVYVDGGLLDNLPTDVVRQIVQKHAVHINGLSFAHGRKCARNRHCGAQRPCQGAVLEDVRLAADQVGGHAAKRNGHVIERRNSVVRERDAINKQPDLMTRYDSRGS